MRFDGLFVCWDKAVAGGSINAAQAKASRAAARQPIAFKVALGPGAGKAGGAHPGARSFSAERHERAKTSSSLVTAALVILAASAALFYATMRRGGEHVVPEPAAAHAVATPHVHKTDPVAAARFARPAATSCDGRMRCSQMNSCAEAKYFLENCPSAAAEMDSNLNGIPCDTQWCTAGAASPKVPL